MENNNNETFNDPLSDDSEENLRMENELLRLRLKAELGGDSHSSGNLDPALENEFLKQVMAFESNYANRFMPILVDTISKNSFSIGLKLSGLNCDNKKAMGSITDYSQGMETKIVTATLDITGFYLTWDQRHSEGFGQFSGATGMTLPAHFVLQKQ